MNIITTIKRWFGMVFGGKAIEEFEVKNVVSNEMEKFINECSKIYHGEPVWLSLDEDMTTVNFAKFICSEVAKLATLGMKITMDGENPRFDIIQKQIDEAKSNIRQWIEYAGAYGTIILKPNGQSIDCVLPNKFMVTDKSNGRITGAVFVNQEVSEDGKVWWTRLEYHRFINDTYVITNKCYRGASQNDIAKPVPIEETPWKDIQEEVGISNLDTPLFGVLKMPNANSIDVDSPLSMPIFADAVQELKALDIAYSRNIAEIFDSKRTVLMDADRLIPTKGNMDAQVAGWAGVRKRMNLPRYVQNVFGNGTTDFYQEINPTLNTQTRLDGINALLSQIGFKCGFSNGYFVFNQTTGFTTATQVTADQARTIQLIEDIRKNLDACLIDVIKAINVFEDLYGTTGHIEITDTVSTDELDRMIHIHFEPIYTNKEEDRMRALQLTNSGYYPKWYYLHLYEGLSEEEAKALVEEAMPKEEGLFDE